jgi:hypothetical protein
MSPKQYENQIATFLKNTQQKCHELIRKYEILETESREWLEWDDDAYTDDFTGFLGEINKVTKDYFHLLEV